MQPEGSLEQHGFAFDPLRIRQAAGDGADGLARLAAVEPDALRAERRFNLVDLVTAVNRVVRAFGLACAAVDAVVGDEGRQMSALDEAVRGLRC